MTPVSACLIVKDEARHIGRALASLARLPGLAEIVVVDTGSSDGTPAIAQSAGATVHHCPWRSDFAWHRNHCAALARNDLIFVLDGDEELTDAGDLGDFLAGPTAGGALLTADGAMLDVQCEYNREGTGSLIDGECSQQVRLYDRRRGIWRFAVHNQLVGLETVWPSNARIRSRYDGALHDAVRRRLAVVQEHRKADSQEPHWLRCVVQAHVQLGEWPEALAAANDYLAREDDDPACAAVAVWKLRALVALGRVREAAAALGAMNRRWPDFADFHYYRVGIESVRWQRALAAAPRTFPGLAVEGPSDPAAVAGILAPLALPVVLRRSP